MKTRLKLFFKWGIAFEDAYKIEEKSERKVQYADSREVERNIVQKYPPEPMPIEFSEGFDNPDIDFSEKKRLPRTRTK